jgi:hypothetical protein
MHVVVVVAFTSDSKGNSDTTATFLINGASAQSRTKTLPKGFGSFDASDWDQNGHMLLFPTMEVTVPRSAQPGNVYYVAIHNKVSQTGKTIW